MTQDREYRDPPPETEFEREVKQLDSKARARRRAEFLRDQRQGRRAFSYNSHRIQLNTAPRVRADGTLEVWVEPVDAAYPDGTPVNPFIFSNPPTKVWDGTWHKETIDGGEVDVRNMREDPGEAFRQMVGQAVERVG